MYYFSNSLQTFYSEKLRASYEASGAWPSDAQAVDTDNEKSIRELQMTGRLATLTAGRVTDGGYQPGYARAAAAPSQCTPAQGLVTLFALKGITEEDVLEAIAGIPDGVQRYTVKIGYQRATTWERISPAMQAMAQLLQLSEKDLDELFTYAAGVTV